MDTTLSGCKHISAHQVSPGMYDELVICHFGDFNFTLGIHLIKELEVTRMAASGFWDQLAAGTFGLCGLLVGADD